MSTDDDLRRMMEAQDLIRRAADPLARYRGALDPLGDATRLDRLVDPTAGQIARLAEESYSLRHLVDRSGFADADVAGAISLAKEADQYRKLLAGPVEEYRRLASFGTVLPFRDSISGMLTAYEKYEQLFRLPELDEATRLARGVLSGALGARLHDFDPAGASIEAAMRSMQSPWLYRDHIAESAHAFAELQVIGRAVRMRPPFEDALSASLRGALGDWRGVTALPESIFQDAAARSDFYVDLGFDATLTEFTAEAFDETTALAGLRLPVDEDGDSDDDEAGLSRTNAAHAHLQRFERKVRRFIDALMTKEFGDVWIKSQTPDGMLDSWKKKKAAAEDYGDELPLIAYADFTDYIKIIERGDNWSRVFKPVFNRRESVKESFVRLFPIRNGTMHGRLVTLDDVLYLQVELIRLTRAMGLSLSET